MTYIAKPTLHHPSLERTRSALRAATMKARISTLCAGCGHDSISASIIQACFEIASLRTGWRNFPASAARRRRRTYFLSHAHGFNAVHGRMPSVLTGANLANRDLIYLGVSGDGDTASIGLGQFAHAIRRGVNMTYIVENNGVYGLTKGQFSATADQGSKSKKGVDNNDNADRSGHAGAATGRDLCRALLLRRQEPSSCR